LHRPGLLVYFSTCAESDTDYVRHKRELEQLVKDRGTYLICRLPIVAGKTSNPHTLLNFLHDRIQRSEEFDLFTKARRNVIDVADAAAILEWLVRGGAHNQTINVAAPQDYAVTEIVGVFERITGKKAVVNRIDSGDSQDIDVRRISEADVDFSGDYLGRVLRRYYK
jgi:nucleoside-diphosphate-sugar epimerase